MFGARLYTPNPAYLVKQFADKVVARPLPSLTPAATANVGTYSTSGPIDGDNQYIWYTMDQTLFMCSQIGFTNVWTTGSPPGTSLLDVTHDLTGYWNAVVKTSPTMYAVYTSTNGVDWTWVYESTTAIKLCRMGATTCVAVGTARYTLASGVMTLESNTFPFAPLQMVFEYGRLYFLAYTGTTYRLYAGMPSTTNWTYEPGPNFDSNSRLQRGGGNGTLWVVRMTGLPGVCLVNPAPTGVGQQDVYVYYNLGVGWVGNIAYVDGKYSIQHYNGGNTTGSSTSVQDLSTATAGSWTLGTGIFAEPAAAPVHSWGVTVA